MGGHNRPVASRFCGKCFLCENIYICLCPFIKFPISVQIYSYHQCFLRLFFAFLSYLTLFLPPSCPPCSTSAGRPMSAFRTSPFSILVRVNSRAGISMHTCVYMEIFAHDLFYTHIILIVNTHIVAWICDFTTTGNFEALSRHLPDILVCPWTPHSWFLPVFPLGCFRQLSITHP